MPRPTPEQLDAALGQVVPDLIPEPCRLLFVGINPSPWTAATGAHFARPGNRFYPALQRAGLVDRLIDASAGYSEADLAHLHARGIGVTNLAPRATARAAELSAQELRAGAARLESLVREAAPGAVAVVGITAYRTAFGRPRTALGLQPQGEWIGGAPTYVLPNPSGLNAHESVDSLARAYAGAGRAAGLL